MADTLSRLQEINDLLTEKVISDPSVVGQIIDVLPDGLLIINEEGKIQFVNQQMELMFGYSSSDLIGKEVHMLLPAELRDLHREHLKKYFSLPSVRPMNMAKVLSGLHRTGRTVHVQISLGPLISSQGVLALALIRRVVDAK